MKIIIISLICSGVLLTVYSNTVNNVRLINHEGYIVPIIEKTMQMVEEKEWCNLRVNDVSLDLEEDVLGSEVLGKVEYTNGFVVSIQWLDIIKHTVQQVWRYDRVTNASTVEVRAAMRMHAVTLGFDVLATLAEGAERYTATFLYPLLQFDFTIIKDMSNLDQITVTVLGTVPRNTNVPRFMPLTKNSQVFASLYDWNSTSVGIRSWGPEVFEPIVYELATKEFAFPRICYNCPVV